MTDCNSVKTSADDTREQLLRHLESCEAANRLVAKDINDIKTSMARIEAALEHSGEVGKKVDDLEREVATLLERSRGQSKIIWALWGFIVALLLAAAKTHLT